MSLRLLSRTHFRISSNSAMIPSNLQSVPKLLFLALAAALLVIVPTFYLLAGTVESSLDHNSQWAPGSVGRNYNPFKVNSGEEGGSIMGQMKNETAKSVALLTPPLDDLGAIRRRNSKNCEYATESESVADSTYFPENRAEVGRASWKLLHTMAARYPENPTADEKETYRDFLHLFSRLYPCGECSAEFIQLLKQYPPQV